MNTILSAGLLSIRKLRAAAGASVPFFLSGLIGALLLLMVPQPALGQARALKAVTIELPKNTEASRSYVTMVSEIYALIGKETGLKIELQVLPYARAVAMMEVGEVDLMMALSTGKLLDAAELIAPVMSVDVIIVGRAGSRFESLEELRGKTVGVINGPRYHEPFWDDQRIAKYKAATQEQSLRMLLAGRFDAVLGTREFISLTLRTMGLDHDVLGEPLLLDRQHSSLHFSKKNYHPETADALTHAVSKLMQRKTIQKIHDKYLGTASARE